MRTSDTKLLRAWPQARSEFPSVRRITDRRGKILVLCHIKRTTYEGHTQAERTPGGLTLASRLDVAQGHTVPETPVV
jgi:hypothetical protein